MTTAYYLNSDGSTVSMNPVRCADEEKELQRLLEKNPDLLPGDQINPNVPRHWLPVAREMPVPDPSTGEDRWAIDFVFLDQDAIPTFVECKRFADTRSRREVVAQMLEYAANGHHYWTGWEMRKQAERFLGEQNRSLEEGFSELIGADDEAAIEAYFEDAEANLRKGRLRLIFFLEEAPNELKSIVDFLNRQMEQTEVLLVEAKQYELDGCRVVVPTLFGFTEEARVAKKVGEANSAGRRRQWTEGEFMAQLSERTDASVVDAVQHIMDTVIETEMLDFRMGTGTKDGSINVVAPSISHRSLFTLWTHGKILINFGWLGDTEAEISFRNRLKEALERELGWEVPEDWERKWLQIAPEQWVPNARKFLGLVMALTEESTQPLTE